MMTILSRLHTFSLTILTLLLSGAMEQSVHAQPAPEDDRPRLVLNTHGPSSRTRALEFSNDSARLFAAGFDKTVHVWDVGWNNQGPDLERDQATPIQTLRWEISRANRGLINTMAFSPTAERLAIGGQSARGANGDIIVMDVDRYEVEGALPAIRDDRSGLPGHLQSVTSLDFSPDGNRVISSGSDGNVWVWTAPPGGQGLWTFAELRPARDVNQYRLFNEQPAIFLTPDVVAVSEPLDATYGQWRIALYSVAGGIRRLGELPQLHVGYIPTMTRSRDGRFWATADDAGHVFLWTGGGQPTAKILRHWARIPSDMSFGPGGQILAVSNLLDNQSQAVVELYDTASGQLVDLYSISVEEHCNAVTISPNGQFLATHADDSQDVLVFRLIDGAGQLIPKPLSGQPPIRLHSRADRVTRVAFKKPQPGQPTYQIGFSTSPDRQILSEFDFSGPDLRRFAGPAPVETYITPDTFAAGWQAVRAENGQVVVLVQNGREVSRIPLNAKRQGEFEGHYCIIPDGQGRPFAVAIGTTNQNGIYAYSLPVQGQPPRLLRYFRDHNGEILSVGVSHDGRFLVSGSEDQTIKVWSLAGLANVNPAFPQSSIWGADFGLEGGQVVVRNVLNMGIAYGRQLRDGDVIAAMQFGLENANGPGQMKAVLDQREPWEPVVLTVNRGGQLQKPVVIVPGWEPLMTLLVDQRDEWALFTPEGFYDASVAEGQTLFGWQINRGRNYTPRFLSAETLQKDFERPDLLRNLLGAGSVVDALQGNNEPVPVDFTENIAAKAGGVPDVKILEPLASQQFGPGEEITVKAEIRTAPGVDPNMFDVRATVGGRFVGDATEDVVADQPGADGRTSRLLTYKTTTIDQLNRIQIFAVDNKEDALLNAANNTATNFNRGDPPEQTQLRRLHVLALASDNYDNDHWPKLDYPLKDMEEIVHALENRDRHEGLYELGRTTKLRNEFITPSSVAFEIEEIKKQLSQVKPYDVVFVYLAGHGKAVNNLYHYVPPIHTRSDAEIAQKGIPWTQLKAIADLKCNVIWMLDTCESGSIVNKSSVREMGKLSMVVAASEEEAFEGEQYGGGHGAFTASILSGLQGSADNTGDGEGIADDDVITVAELVSFVKDEVYANTGRNQKPVITPSDLVESPGTIQLAKVAPAAASGP
ncbi:MAG: hypothetical protein KDA86_00115 [Planctomycetaceae bacterium]|nr:hypothetical protein [Planctomycetaceae bacterium]